jgi:hypothetical protein
MGDSCRFALQILQFLRSSGTRIPQLSGITLEAFRIAGGLLLFGIGMEMVHAKTSRTKMTTTGKDEFLDMEDIARMPPPSQCSPPRGYHYEYCPDEQGAHRNPAYGRFCDILDWDHLLYDAEFRLYHAKDRTAGVPGNQQVDGNAPELPSRSSSSSTGSGWHFPHAKGG